MKMNNDCQAHPALSPTELGQLVSEHTGDAAKLQLQPCTFASGELLAEWGCEQHLNNEGAPPLQGSTAPGKAGPATSRGQETGPWVPGWAREKLGLENPLHI